MDVATRNASKAIATKAIRRRIFHNFPIINRFTLKISTAITTPHTSHASHAPHTSHASHPSPFKGMFFIILLFGVASEGHKFLGRSIPGYKFSL
ncbi:MAG: hypothetical protein F6J93_17755 [Oscillatoria sp. SIO1A7]|nr:hypothetical protein [Oscillatoria sp. SIO1A7]